MQVSALQQDLEHKAATKQCQGPQGSSDRVHQRLGTCPAIFIIVPCSASCPALLNRSLKEKGFRGYVLLGPLGSSAGVGEAMRFGLLGSLWGKLVPCFER